MIRIGVDIGGTFTDFVAVDQATGHAGVWKRLSTPDSPSEAVIAGIRDLLDERDWEPADVELIVHGTTLVANALIERTGAATALVATAGHRDVLDVGREMRYDIYDLFLERPEPLVPRSRRFTIRERLSADGTELLPLDAGSFRDVARALSDLAIESIAVSFMHGYIDGAHEVQAARILAEQLPGVPITLSSEIAPEMREYERTSTTVANAYVRPLVERYITSLEHELRTALPNMALFIMLSHGGLGTPSQASKHPIHLVESGPAAGAVAAAACADSAHPNLLAFDMGGTTAKLCVIQAGTPTLSHQMEVARRVRFKRGSGLPLLVPTIDLIEVGAGGGSIAHVDRQGLLKVGPQSAGASPGPACYGQGGSRPTVTDANLILGYIGAESMLAGRMQLYPEAAEAALASLGNQVGMSALDVARGVHGIINESMAVAAKRHVAEHARDPRDHALVAFGGCGPSHAYELARKLRIDTVISPPAAGAASALGCLMAPATVELARTRIIPLASINWGEVRSLYEDLAEAARSMLSEARVAADSVEISRMAEMRYAGQGSEVPVDVSDSILATEDSDLLSEAFRHSYAAHFGHSLTETAIEIVTLRLIARGPAHSIRLSRDFADTADARRARVRRAYFDETGFVSCPVYARSSMASGTRISGPALVEDPESTTVVGPSATAVLDGDGGLILSIGTQTR